MLKTQKAAATLALSLAFLPLSAGLALAANNGPIVHDYSNTGPSYQSPSGKSGGSGGSSAGQTSASNAGGGAAAGTGSKPYKVKCSGGKCRAGPQVMQGYQVYGGHCARCHGESGEGSTFAPSLVNAIQNGSLGEGKYAASVANGISKMDTTTGTYRVMPSWGNNPKVMGSLTQIWAYLKARADGKLGSSRPQPIK